MRLLPLLLSSARIAACLVALSSPLKYAAAAPTLLVENGVLIGANGVLVDGAFYDVRFVEGSCNSLFAGCTSFTFASQAAATSASQALLDQVLFDGSEGNFDSNPQLTAGCTDPIFCYVLTPFNVIGPQVTVLSAVNNAVGADLAAFLGPIGLGASTANVAFETYAVWAQSTTVSVPEGDSLSLVGAAALAALWARRRKGRSVSRSWD